MNCCDYDCTQGRDCPARVAKVGQRMPAADPLPRRTWRDNLHGVATAVVLVLACVGITTITLTIKQLIA